MDTGSKSLAQLSEEGKEKKYVTVEIGSKVSGYTQEYLERLCRLRKVEYLLRGDGSFAIELESLLNETHTILLSYEGITFIERSTLTAAPPAPPKEMSSSAALKEVTTIAAVPLDDVAAPSVETPVSLGFAQPVPRFGDMNHLNQQAFGGNPFSFVGRPVISDGKTSDASVEKEIHIPIGGGQPGLSPESLPHTPTSVPLAVHADTEKIPVATVSAPAPVSPPPAPESHPEPTHLHIMLDRKEPIAVSAGKSAVPTHGEVPHKPTPVKLEVVREGKEEKKDDWDDLFSGVEAPAPTTPHTDVPAPVSAPTPPAPALSSSTPAPVLAPASVPAAAALPVPPSIYHPIQTSPDATVHHDDAPLFPVIEKAGIPPAPRPSLQSTPSSFTPPSGQRVVVFDPGVHNSVLSSESKSIIPPAPIIPRAMPVPEGTIPPVFATPVSMTPSVAPSLLPGAPLAQAMSPRSPVPLMRVMPQVALAETESHQMALRTPRPLVSLQALAFLFVGTGTLLLLGGVALDRLGIDPSSTSYVAAVGASAPVPLRADPPAPAPGVLPFSNDLVVSTNTPSGMLEVTPVFENGTGTTHRYDTSPSLSDR